MESLFSFLLVAVPDYPLWLVGYICLSFFLAGLVKGFLGMGMPAVLIILLTLFLPPLEAIPLIVLPMLVVNIFSSGARTNPLPLPVAIASCGFHYPDNFRHHVTH